MCNVPVLFDVKRESISFSLLLIYYGSENALICDQHCLDIFNGLAAQKKNTMQRELYFILHFFFPLRSFFLLISVTNRSILFRMKALFQVEASGEFD